MGLHLGNLFEMAEKRLIRQGKVYIEDVPAQERNLISRGKVYDGRDVINGAVKIRKWLDKHNNVANKRNINRALRLLK